MLDPFTENVFSILKMTFLSGFRNSDPYSFDTDPYPDPDPVF